MRFDQLNRRDVLTLVGGGAAAWPLGAHAQRPGVPVLGFMSDRSPEDIWLPHFGRGLQGVGFVEGQNVTVEYRWARGDYGKLPGFAAELVTRPVNVLLGVWGRSIGSRREGGDFDNSNRILTSSNLRGVRYKIRFVSCKSSPLQ